MSPVKPSGQMQIASAPLSSQIAPFWHCFNEPQTSKTVKNSETNYRLFRGNNCQQPEKDVALPNNATNVTIKKHSLILTDSAV